MAGPAQSAHHRGALQRVGAIIAAAGDSRRMGEVDKILASLNGRPLIAYSLQVLNDYPDVEAIVLVMSHHNVEEGRRLVRENGWHKVTEVCAGGVRRQDSVRRGIERLPDTEWTLVHDGARPCIDYETVARGLVEARESGAAVAAVPLKDTVKSAGPDRIVTQTLTRDGLWAVQTPQVFKTELLAQAHREVSQDVTDDASMVEIIGATVRIFTGSYDNIKVTSPEDMPIVEAILKARSVAKPTGDT